MFELLVAEAEQQDNGSRLVPVGTFQEEQIDTEERDSASVADHEELDSPEKSAVAPGIVRDMVEDTSYFLVLRGA